MPFLPPPDVVAVEVPVDELEGTAKSLALSAARAGYRVRATRALGPRVPRMASQEVERVGSLALVGTMHSWAFSACLTARDGWDVTMYRPGWPVALGSVTALRETFKAQTPHDLGKANCGS